MKHVRPLSQAPSLASNNVPTSVIILFIQDVLGAMLNLFVAKETVGTPTTG